MDRLGEARQEGRVGWNGARLPKVQSAGRVDVYETVTRRIIERIEAGVVPWQSPSIAGVGFPRNFSTGKYYQGINIFLLSSYEFQSPYFLTFLQARNMGGVVRRGETGFPIVKMGTWTQEDGSKEFPSEKDAVPTRSRMFLRLYTVFNACQIEGIKFPDIPKCPAFTETEMTGLARRIVAQMPQPPIISEGRKSTPHYVPSLDTVEMPSRETFRAEWRFYKTLFHELAHSTGHEKRLNRASLTENRGMYAAGETRKIYCLEELVAEMAAAFLGAHSGIVQDGDENSAAYLQGWLNVLKVKDNKTWLVRAASEAQRAADFILGVAGSRKEASRES
ncbi:MAG: zincin-like metallopeptidase domain-containing protein [Verrucomicrobiota bacterium]